MISKCTVRLRRFDEFFATLAGLGHDYGSFARAPLLQQAVTMDGIHTSLLMGFPGGKLVNDVLSKGLSLLGRALGYQPFYDSYINYVL